MKSFKDDKDGYYEFADDAPESSYAHLTPCEPQAHIPTPEEIIGKLKIARDEALNSLTHDFGDGRIMQTRPKDESNIRNAIEIMEANNIPSIGWSMLDDIKQDVTAAELKTALSAAQLAAMAIWVAYNP